MLGTIFLHRSKRLFAFAVFHYFWLQQSYLFLLKNLNDDLIML
jgi:hypothetical protein